MELTDLPTEFGDIRPIHLIDWSPAIKVTANPGLLKAKRRSKTGTKQSEHSRARQSFISGMDADTALPVSERAERKAYLEEWEIRMSENEFID